MARTEDRRAMVTYYTMYVTPKGLLKLLDEAYEATMGTGIQNPVHVYPGSQAKLTIKVPENVYSALLHKELAGRYQD